MDDYLRDTNPSSGLPMCGGVDIAGNPFGESASFRSADAYQHGDRSHFVFEDFHPSRPIADTVEWPDSAIGSPDSLAADIGSARDHSCATGPIHAPNYSGAMDEPVTTGEMIGQIIGYILLLGLFIYMKTAL